VRGEVHRDSQEVFRRLAFLLSISKSRRAHLASFLGVAPALEGCARGHLRGLEPKASEFDE
jgi:hypothetical protein